MRKKKYIPGALGKLKTWLVNYKEKIAIHGGTLGLSAGDITAQQGWCDTLIKAIDNITLAKQDYKEAVSDERTAQKLVVDSITNAATAFKTNPAYTPGIGNALGIIGEENGFDPLTWKTVLTYVLYADHVRINFIKDETEGVNIYARLKRTAAWTFLGLDTHSPYSDSRPLAVAGTPEVREYMSIGVIDDEELPTQSDIIEVTVR